MEVLNKLEKTLEHSNVALDEAIAILRQGRELLAQLQPSVVALPKLIDSAQRLLDAHRALLPK